MSRKKESNAGLVPLRGRPKPLGAESVEFFTRACWRAFEPEIRPLPAGECFTGKLASDAGIDYWAGEWLVFRRMGKPRFKYGMVYHVEIISGLRLIVTCTGVRAKSVQFLFPDREAQPWILKSAIVRAAVAEGLCEIQPQRQSA